VKPKIARIGPKLRGLLMVTPPVLVIVVFVCLSILACLVYTLGYGGGINATVSGIAMHQNLGFPTTKAYQGVLTDAEFLASLRATVGVTVVTTVVVIALAWCLALWLRAGNSRVAKAITALSVVPMFIPGVIGAYAILQFYAPNGFPRTIAYHLGWHSAPSFAYTLTGVVIGSVWGSLPFAVLMITSGMGSVPEALLEAARDVGASPWRRFWSVILPLTLVPTIITAAFTAIGTLGSFTLPYIVGPTAPALLGPLMQSTYTSFNQPQQAEVMAVTLFVLALVAGVPYVWANFVTARRSGGVR
jgi:ABC-type spermidine/putrescine transport system permease subunit I